MKISSTKKAAILATVLGGFVLGSSAEAANLGVVTASDYVTSHMGALQGSYINSDDIKAVKSVISGLNGDPAVYNTVDPITGKSSLYIRQYTYSTVNLQNSFAFDAQGDWNNRVAGSVSEATNAHDVARYKDFVYVASYDEGTIGVGQVTDTVISDKTVFTRNLKEDLKLFGSDEVREVLSDSRASLHGEGVVIIDGSLYVVANVNPKGGYDPYSPSYLIKYIIKENGSLSYDGYTTMGKNTDSVALNVYNNYMLATAIGGYQYYGAENSNAETSIDVVTLNPENKRFMDTRQITLPENLLQVRDGKTIPKSEFRSLKVLPNGTAYVMTYNIGKAGKNVDVTVYQTTVSNLLSSKPQNWKEVYKQEAAPGWFGRLDAEYNTKRLWVQVGNKLHIYTDGATDPKVFGTDSFAANSMYEELYTWDIISTDVIPEGNLVKLNVVNNVEADKVIANAKAPTWNNNYTNINQRLENVTGSVTIENNVTNPLIHLDGTVEGNKTNNVLAGIYAEGVNTSVNSSNGLQIQVQNNIASPVGIYAGNGGSVKYYGSNSELNIITKTMDGGNTLTNAVWLDPSVNGGETITLQSASTNITMEGGYGGNGVAIQKTDRWGENSKESTKGGSINITGDLNIKGKDNGTWGIEANPTNVLSRFNNVGILVDVNNSSVTVGGNVDMDVYGNGVTVTGDNSTVTLQKGGTITVPKGTEYGYYALAAYDGTINMNANAGANAVKLNGDIFVTNEGTVNLGLATGDSYLKGIIDNGGTANLTLINGAKWYNEANNTRYYQDNEDKGSNERSHVTTLKGGTTFDDAGTIIQTANSKNLWVDNLTGAVKVKYDSYDVGENVTVNGGNVTIDTAEAGSLVGLYAPNKGFGADDTDTVNAVLNALANKLYYNGYMQRGATLQGYVTIGEGITSSSITNNYAKEITFTEHGQGTTTGEGTGINPDTPDSGDGEGEGEGGEVEKVIPSALLNNVANNVISQGTIDINSEGHGITVDASGAMVKITGGGNITVPQGNENNYYALKVDNGSVYMALSDGYSSSCTFDGSGDTEINGDLYVASTGSMNIGIKGEGNYLNGAIVNEGTGVAKLVLLNNAQWTNVSTNSKKGITSYLTNLGVNSGARIEQTADSGDIVIENYGGEYKYYNKKKSPTGMAAGYYQTKGSATVYYTHDLNSPTIIHGGNIVIQKSMFESTKQTMNADRTGYIVTAWSPSTITLCTNYSSNITKDNVQNVLNSLANKLYYLGYIYQTDEDGNVKTDSSGNPLHTDEKATLNAYVKINEGLVGSSISVELLQEAGILDENDNVDSTLDKVTYKDNSLNANVIFNGTTGQGSLTGELIDGTGFYEPNEDNYSFVDKNGAYARPIYGKYADDISYAKAGILQDGVYNFTEPVNVFNTSQKMVYGGAWHSAIGVAIASHGKLVSDEQQPKTMINLNNNDLVITNTTKGSGASITAIDRGIIEINNAGNIIINENGHGPTAGIFANSGGEVYIDNANGGVVTIRTSAGGGGGTETGYGESGACLKTMNGVSDVRSKIVITGMVDLVADLNTCNNEAISSVASTIEVGGGNIQAINGAWAAIRAYGEFVSDNASVVNVNVIKQTDADGNVLKDPNDSNVDLIAGAGDNKTTIYGDFVTNGGMGTKGNISVGLGTADSYWIGNYGDTRGYGVTKGMEGEVNLYMKNGASWTGFTDGEMNVTMEGEGTTWLGYNVAERKADDMGNVNGGLVLTLKDGAVWKNAITTEQKHNDTVQDAKVYDFNGDGGFIDMTGNETFIGKNSASHADGSNGVSFKNTSIIFNDTPQETGNLVINNYSGDTTVIYRHDNENVTNILGGTTTIKKAAAGSNITLSTDSTGIDMTNTTEVTNVLDNLAEKLFYTAYATENERNLSGKVQIAEGLTTSSVGKYFGDIAFSTDNGQGSLKAGSLSKPVDPSEPPTGGEGEEEKPEDKPVEPEKPEVKPVLPHEFKGDVNTGDLDNLKQDDVLKDAVTDDGNLDFGKVNAGKEEKGEDKIDIFEIHGSITHKHNGTDEPFVNTMGGADLAIRGNSDGEATNAPVFTVTGGTYEIVDAGNVTFDGNVSVSGDDTNNKGKLHIDNAENGGVAMFKAKDGAEGNANGAVLEVGKNAEVVVTGKVDITQTNGNVALNVGEGSTVSFGGGVIGGTDSDVAIQVTEGGKIKINEEAKDHDVVINGKIVLGVAKPVEEQVQPVVMKLMRRISVPQDKSSVTMTTAGSVMKDDVAYSGYGDNDFYASFSNDAKWTGSSTGGVALDVYLSDSGVWTGYHENTGSNTLNMEIGNGGTWTNTATTNTVVDTMSGEGGFVEMSETAGAGLEINSYSGDTTFIYANNYGKDVEDDKLIKGGDVTITAVTGNSNIATMRTNNIGTSDKGEVDRVLKALAEKLAYTGYASNKDALTGKVQIMEGMTGSSVTREGQIKFDDTTGKGSLNTSVDVKVDYTGDYIYGDSETAMMKGAKSAMASTVMMWRSESNDLLQRMGDVRLATEESGVWAKYYGGKYEMDAQNTNFTTNYKAYQVGYDKAVGNGWNVGVAVSHNEGDSRYDRGGEGEMTVTSLSVYGNKDYGDGRYLGLILKGSQLKNEYEVFNNDGYKLEGDFKTWGTSISAEYGKRIEKGNGFYFDPSVELTIGHVQGKDYTATSDMLAAYGKTATMQVEQDDFNSIIGRVGFGIGQRTDKASYYAKLALAHEFGGDFDTHYTAEETKGTNIDFGDTWYEMQLGGTAKLSDNSLLYATYERSFGGDVTEKWRVDAGLRVTF